MPNEKSRKTPSYRLHKSSGRALVTLPSGVPGQRGKEIFLGRFGSPESHEKYARVMTQWRVGGLPAASDQASVSIVELLDRYREHCERTYSRGRRAAIGAALKPLRELYGRTTASEFGPLALLAVRQRMIEKKWCRNTVNEQVRRVRSFFGWCVSMQLVPAMVLVAIREVKGLRFGAPGVTESSPVRCVPQAHVDAIRLHVPPTVWAMIEVQRLTGARPAEVCLMRTADLDTSGKVWLCAPRQHKNCHHGIDRVIPIGPKAQAIIEPFLKHDLSAYIFSALESVRAARARNAGGQRRLDQAPTPCRTERHIGDHYTVSSYRRAIARACEAAGTPKWAPNQLRHSFATEARKRFGLETSRQLMGHRSISTTQVYAEADVSKAVQLAARFG